MNGGQMLDYRAMSRNCGQPRYKELVDASPASTTARRPISVHRDLGMRGVQDTPEQEPRHRHDDAFNLPRADSTTASDFDFEFGSALPTPINSQVDLHHESTEDRNSVIIQSEKPIATTRPRRELNIQRIWTNEFLACCLSLVALIGMTVTMVRIEDRPLPRLPFAVSINTLIAVYAAVSQGCAAFVLSEGLSQMKWTWYRTPRKLHDFLVYDNASRGPWGAVQLLWCLKRSPGFAFLGAVLTVAVVVLDPVSQQLVWFDNGHDISSSTATISRTSVYNEHISDVYYRPDDFGWETRPSNEFIASMAFGQFSDKPMQVPFQCATGNCTFEHTYSSVGYCSSCTDVSAYASVPYIPNAGSTKSCSKTILEMSNRSLTFDSTQSFRLQYDGSDAHQAVYMVWGDSSTDINSRNCTPSVYECSLSPCIHTFRGEVVNGQLIEEVVDRNYAFGNVWVGVPEQYLSVADLECIDIPTRKTLTDLGYNFNSSTRWLPYNVSWEPGTIEGPDHFTQPLNLTATKAGLDSGMYTLDRSNWTLSDAGLHVVPTKCLYQIGRSTVEFLHQNAFPYYFNGSIEATNDGVVMGAPVAMDLRVAGFQSVDNATAAMQRIADAMTASMRAHGSPNASAPASGAVEHYAVIARIRWPYIAYMAAVNALLLLFFVVVVVQTRPAVRGRAAMDCGRGGAECDRPSAALCDFKSHALATLFHGFDAYSLKALGELGKEDQVRELEEESKRHRFVLVPSEQGWKLGLVDVRS